MKKNILIFIAMLLAGVNTAWGQNVAKIGDTEYATLEAAFAAANGATTTTTITLLADVTVTETITLNPTKTVTFDLNGHTVSSTSTLGTTFKLTKGTLYVKDLGTTKGGISVSGEAFRIDSRESGVTSKYGAKLEIYENVNVTSSGDCCVFIRGFATVNTSGNLTSQGTYAAIQGNGSDTQGSEINVKKGFVKSTQEAAIYHPQKGTLTISGGTVEGYASGVAIKAGTLDVYGNSVIRATAPANIPTTGWSNGVNASGCAIQIESNSDYDSNGVSVTIRTVTSTNIPTIESTNGAAVYEYVGKGSNTMLSTLKITGGTFTGGSGQQALLTSEQAANAKAVSVSGGSFSSAVNAAYCADGYAPTDNGSGTYGVTLQNEAKIGETYYTTFTAAADAAGANDVIVLLAKPADPYTMSSADKTLKVEKKTFSCTINAYEGYVIAYTTADGVTTYTQTAAKVKFTAASNGAVTYLSNIDNSWSKAGTYQLLDDISWTRVPVSANVTLDLNGHTWTSTQDADFNVLFFKSGSNNLTLNIVDTSTGKGGKIVNTTANGIVGISNSGNTVNISEGVILEGNSVVITGTNNTLNVDGTINGGNTFAIATNGIQTTNATINIKSGAVITSNDVAVYLPGTGTTTVEDGATITGATAIYQKSGTLNIEGGTINGTGAAAEYSYNGNGANATGDAIVVESCAYPGGAPTTVITGSPTITSTNGVMIADHVYTAPGASETPEPTITSQSNTITLPEGEMWVETSTPGIYEIGEIVATVTRNNVTTNHATLESALTAAYSDGTITLLKDVEFAGGWTNAGVNPNHENNGYSSWKLTIDGDGHKITPATGASTEFVFSFNLYNKVDFKDVVFDGWTSNNVLVFAGGTVSLDGVTITNTVNTASGSSYGLIRTDNADFTATNCSFTENTCAMVIGVNIVNGAGGGDVTITNNLFSGNACDAPGVVYFNKNTSGTKSLTNNTFTNNIVTTSENGSVVYCSGTVNAMTGNLFSSNEVSVTADKKEGVIVCGSGAGNSVINGNAFDSNTLGTTATHYATIYTGADIDVSNNYWGGAAASESDIYDSGAHTITNTNYATAYTANTESNGATVTLAPVYVAQITVGETTTKYESLEAAIEAVGNGEQINLLANVELAANAVCPLTDGQSFQLEFGNYTVTKGNYSVQLAKGVMAKTSTAAAIFAIKDDVTDAVIVNGPTHAQAGHYAYYAATTVTEVPYINHEGAAATTAADVPVVVIDEHMDEMITLEYDGWFVVNDDVALTNLTRIGTNNADNVCNFILADGKTLTLGNGSGDSFGGSNSKYTFYGQTTNQTGKLVLGRPLSILNLTQNGGKIYFANDVQAWISADVLIRNGEMNLASSHASSTNDSEPILGKFGTGSIINIEGGVVKVTATGTKGIAMLADDITISGGQIEAIAEGTDGYGMYETSGNTITLSLRDPAQYPDDYIKATNYIGTVEIANGKTLYDTDDNNTAYTGDGTTTVSNDAIANHKLRATNTMPIDNSAITVTVEPATYTGSTIEPVVTVKHGDNTLTKDTDYTIEFDGTYTDAKTYSKAIIIKGKGNYYTGERKADFTIAPRNINDVTVSGNSQNYIADGYTIDAIKAAITLKYNDITLSAAADGDYTITVAEGTYKDPGTYAGVITLTAVEGEGKNFVGSRTVDFIIADAINIADCDITATTVYNGSEQTPATKVVVKRGATTLTEGTDYEITFEGTPNFTNAGSTEITITGKAPSCYGSTTVNYVIEPKNIADCAITTSTPYTGETIVPANVITVKDGETNLAKGTDFNVTVSNGYTYKDVNVYGNAVTITGIGNYTGEVTKDFSITSENATDISAALVTSTAIYNGANQAPSASTVIVKIGSNTINPENYDVTFTGEASDYKDAKTYANAVIITPKSENTSYYGSLTADYVIEQRDLADNAVQATQENKMTWTGNEIVPVINLNPTYPTSDNISLKLITGEAPSANIYYLVATTDYTYTSDPTPIKDPGIYTITFEGRGNFKGTRQLTVNVLKGINNESVELAQNIIIVPNSPNSPITVNDLIVKDGDNTLTLGTNYNATIHTKADASDDAVASISTNDLKNSSDADVAGLIYYVKLTGKDDNSYNNAKIIPFNAVREYVPGALNTTTNPDIDLHVNEVDAGVLNVTLGNKAGENVIATTTDKLVIPSTATISINNKEADAEAQNITLIIQGIEPNAFTGCSQLRWINATALPETFTPNSLDRTVSGTTFYGVPKQSLVFLNGNTITGENYIYKVGDNDFRCDEFKIYDDINGSQTGFTGDDYKWTYENPYQFTANSIMNTRQMKAGQHYTVCLPYDLPIPSTLKAYTLDASSSTILGFKEVTGTLDAFTPYVVIASGTGNLLSISTSGQVPATTYADDAHAKVLNPVPTSNYQLVGTMRYMDGTDAQGMYIMQGDKTWKKIASDSNFDGPCILPMRAYISTTTAIPSGARLTATFTNADGSTTGIRDLQLDNDGDDTFDLQGRKVNGQSAAKGVYIKNGKKLYK